MTSHKDLQVYKESLLLVKDIYLLVALFPKDELFGLTSQMKRCAISIPSNIAEGAGRDTDRQFIQFLSIALASSFEFETQVIVARNLEYLSEEHYGLVFNELKHIQNMLVKLINNFKQN